MDTIISTRDLRKSFATRGGRVEAVRGGSFDVNRGEIFGFLGPNGAGKTTTLRMLTTLLPIDSGSARVAGFDVARQPRQVRTSIGYVSQLGGADELATGRENLILQGRLYGASRAAVEPRAQALTTLLDLADFADRRVRTYSGGQRRRLDIAIGLVHEPAILFLDEPTTGLDPQSRANLWDHVRALASSGTSIFLTTHYLEEADTLCDRLMIMDHGKVVRELTTLDGQVRLYVDDGGVAVPLLIRLLDQSGIALRSISLCQPTLDDVFLRQTGRPLRDDPPAGLNASSSTARSAPGEPAR